MSRPPKEKWQKTATAFKALLAGLKAVVANIEDNVDANGISGITHDLQNKLYGAECAVSELCKYVDSAEECEMD